MLEQKQCSYWIKNVDGIGCGAQIIHNQVYINYNNLTFEIKAIVTFIKVLIYKLDYWLLFLLVAKVISKLMLSTKNNWKFKTSANRARTFSLPLSNRFLNMLWKDIYLLKRWYEEKCSK